MKSNKELLKDKKKIWEEIRILSPAKKAFFTVVSLSIVTLPIVNYLINHIWYVIDPEGLAKFPIQNCIVGTLIYLAIAFIFMFIGMVIHAEFFVSTRNWNTLLIIQLILGIAVLVWVHYTTERYVIIYGIYLFFATCLVDGYAAKIVGKVMDLVSKVLEKFAK